MTPTPAAPLRDYQELAVTLVGEAVRVGRRRLYVELPTGTGKSRILAEVGRATLADGARVLVVAHRRELVRQLAATMAAVTGDSAGPSVSSTWLFPYLLLCPYTRYSLRRLGLAD